MKWKLIRLVMTFLILNGCIHHNPLTGYWTGSMEMKGKTVDIAINFNSENRSFSSQDLMVLEEPISNLHFENGRISFAWITDDQMTFSGSVEKEKISGTVNIGGAPADMKIVFNLSKKSAAPPAKSYSIETLTIESKGAHLSADIYTPPTPRPHPALVLLHGSGPQPKNRYAYDADYFVKLGFEVLIFDKRGAGASTGNHSTASYDDLAQDAIVCLKIMKNRRSVDQGKIGLWGYSQGAMLLPFIAAKTDIPAFLIAKSPEVVSVSEAAAYSDGLRILRSGHSAEDARIVADSHKQVEAMIRNGKDYREVEAFIRQNARKYGFMNQTGLYGGITIRKDEYGGFYWQGRAQNFYSYWKNLTIPTLVLLGEDDEYIDPVKNKAIIESLNNQKITVKCFTHAGHNLKKAFNPAKYPDLDWPRRIAEYPEYVGEWLRPMMDKTKRAE